MPRSIKTSIERNILKKKIGEYKRTSSGGQDLKLQTETNAEYLNGIPEEDKLTFTDYDVSATKLTMDERPALTRMLKMIDNGVISKVIVYERDRLARNVYEYIYIVKKFYEFDIEVIFTATDAPPFSKDLFLETWYGLSAQFEGNRISSRLLDARKRNPASIIGYIKQIVNKENGTSQRIYKADPKNSSNIAQLFHDVSTLDSLEELFEVIMNYKDLLIRTESRIIDILQTPFFAAHKEGLDGFYSKLPNVEPIISLELYKKVQEKLFQFRHGLQLGIAYSNKTTQITPLCHKCRNELKFRKGDLGKSGFYICTKHRTSSISTSELNEKIIDSVKYILSKLSTDLIEKITIKAVNNQMKQLNKQSEELLIKLEALCIKFTNLFKPTDDSKQMKSLHEQIEQVRDQLSQKQTYIASLNLLRNEIQQIIESVKHGLQNLNEKECLELANLLIESIQIQEDYVLFQYYFSDFINVTEDNTNDFYL